ncbi:hypothetical protein POVWA1_069060 [Plasmodium ovale wallikeri]|uniref:Uncharacterized protein n=1 Tax=Plasmodium ovale wallikeri TaxID=864142 RepID=A0A1A9AGN9_PLAOA|nr:hypothetical protein POVWA1_069060 [Plasmodium ovale wallikeri]
MLSSTEEEEKSTWCIYLNECLYNGIKYNEIPNKVMEWILNKRVSSNKRCTFDWLDKDNILKKIIVFYIVNQHSSDINDLLMDNNVENSYACQELLYECSKLYNIYISYCEDISHKPNTLYIELNKFYKIHKESFKRQQKRTLLHRNSDSADLLEGHGVEEVKAHITGTGHAYDGVSCRGYNDMNEFSSANSHPETDTRRSPTEVNKLDATSHVNAVSIGVNPASDSDLNGYVISFGFAQHYITIVRAVIGSFCGMLLISLLLYKVNNNAIKK